MPSATNDYRRLAARTALTTGVVVGVVLLVWLLLQAAQVWLLIFAGLLVAVLLSAAADGLAAMTRMPRSLALLVALALLALGISTAAVMLWPSVSEQIDQLYRDLPAAANELRTWVEQREWGRWLLGRADGGRAIDNDMAIDQATGVVMQALGGLGALVVVLFVGIYVAADPALYHNGLRRLFPVRSRARLDTVVFEVTSVLRWWIVGKLLSMTLVGVLTTAGLWWLGIPLALTFGLLAAILTFIPNFGPILSVVPPALLALVDDPTKALWVASLYLAIQTVESYAITPLIQRRTVSMPPALTITAQVLLGLMVGAIGVAVATPLTAVVMTAIRMTYVEEVLEPRPGDAGL